MKRLTTACAGMLIGCAAGWFLGEWIYPWDTIHITSAGPQAVERIFHFFGLCIGGPVGFCVGSWVGLRWFPKEMPPPPPPLPPVDPRKVEDNLG
jgi:hypothetical protein